MGGTRIKTLSSVALQESSLPIYDSIPRVQATKPVPGMAGWYRTAFIDRDGYVSTGREECHESYGELAMATVDNRTFDLTKSTDWMEYLEYKENRVEDEGGAGAYDTMRCDVVLSDIPSDNSRLRIWGERYHLQRLQRSFLSLLCAKETEQGPDSMPPISQESLDQALDSSREILTQLMSDAQSSMGSQTIEGSGPTIRLFRVTLLWSMPLPGERTNGSKRILVRGHASSSSKQMKVHNSPEPIVVSVAAHAKQNNGDSAVSVDHSLPSRAADPHSKVASWCRLRKKMETPDTFKPHGVSEVLMVRPRKDEEGKERLELLEGLSSNLFVIYKDGTLRTATDGVLNGYVRHLVLGAANKCGLELDPRPIFLDEADQWREAFITSSSRLIYPISKVLLPEDAATPDLVSGDGSSFIDYWTVPDSGSTTPKWQQLLSEILREGGYNHSQTC